MLFGKGLLVICAVFSPLVGCSDKTVQRERLQHCEIDAAVARLQSDDNGVRESAEAELLRAGTRAVPKLLCVIKDRESGLVAARCAAILSRIGDGRAAPAIEELMLRHSIWWMGQVDVERALGKLRQPSSVAAISKQLQRVRMAGEGMIPVPTNEVIHGDLSHPYRAAVIALGEIGSDEAVETMSMYLASYWHVPAAVDEDVAWALGGVGSSRASEVLKKAVVNESLGNRRVLLRALLRKRLPENIEFVRELVSGRDEELKYDANVVLEELGRAVQK